jgi:hypothetical protein
MTTDFNCDGCCRIAVQHTCHDFVPAPEEGTGESGQDSGKGDIPLPAEVVSNSVYNNALNVQLLPCPWCGDQPSVVTSSTGIVTVYCTARRCYINPNAEGYTREEAAIYWNRRAAQPSVSASVAEFEKLLDDFELEVREHQKWRDGLTAHVTEVPAFRDALVAFVRAALTGSPREEEQ